MRTNSPPGCRRPSTSWPAVITGEEPSSTVGPVHLAGPAEFLGTLGLTVLAQLVKQGVRLRVATGLTPEPDPHGGIPFDSDTEEIIAGHARQLSLTDVRQLAHAVD